MPNALKAEKSEGRRRMGHKENAVWTRRWAKLDLFYQHESVQPGLGYARVETGVIPTECHPGFGGVEHRNSQVPPSLSWQKAEKDWILGI